jgi:hypothetical protein
VGSRRCSEMTKGSQSRPLLTHLNERYIHKIVAQDMDLDAFKSILKNQSEEVLYQIEGACLRLNLVDDVKTARRSINSCSNLAALQVYLLLTCLDALSEKKGEDGKNVGVGQRLNNLIGDLPEVLKRCLIQSYVLVSETEQLKAWDELKEEKKLERIKRYLFHLRRNTFTHDALIVPTAVQSNGISGLVGFILDGFWEYSVYFNHQKCGLDEVSLFRLIVYGVLRHKLQLTVDEDWIEIFWQENLSSKGPG